MGFDTTSDPSIDENARRRFEMAWRQGKPEPLANFLPPPSDPHYLATLEELVQIDLEFAWKTRGRTAGESRPPILEDYLAAYPALNEPGMLRRLLRQEHDVRHRHGDNPAPADYRQRFPILEIAWGETVGASPGGGGGSPALPRPEGYEVLSLVGGGGMGVVYEARQPGLDRIVALKMIRGNADCISPDDRERFLAEARVAARLEHPGVVPVHNVTAAPGAPPFYTMKLVRGRTLEDAIQRFHETKRSAGEEALERQRLLGAFLAVTRTMAFAHSRGVIHRDLKPANIVVGDYGETVILDWGLAKILRQTEQPRTAADGPIATGPIEATVQGSVLGTPAFMSPEQAAGRIDELDERSDVFSLGIVLYQILTGRLPFTGSLADVLHQVQEVDPARPRTLSPAVSRPLEAICLRALAKRPADRYPSAAALAGDLESNLAGEPVSAYREAPSERLRRWAKRRRTLVTSAAVAAVLLAIGAVAGLFFRQAAVNERDKQTAEFDRKRNLQRLEHRQAIERAAGELEVLAAAELRADRFEAAEKVLYKAVAGLRGEPELADMRDRLEARRTRVRRLAEFYRLWERTERLAAAGTELTFTKVDDEALAACEGAFQQLGVQPDDTTWWERLPAIDLEPGQRARLENDVSVAQVLTALWLIKKGVLQFGPTGAQTYQKARAMLRQTQAYGARRGEPSRTAEILEIFCRYRLAEPAVPALQPPPRTAADAYFVGITHLFITDMSAGSLSKLVYRLLPRDLWDRTGIDFQTPQITSERMLRTATALDSKHYWAHFWLGMSLLNARDWPGAEQAFNACVALRPEYAYGFTWRAASLLVQLEQLSLSQARMRTDTPLDRPEIAWLSALASAPGPGDMPLGPLTVAISASVRQDRVAQAERTLADLKRRTQRGLIQGAIQHPHNAYVQWMRARFLSVQQRWPETAEACSVAAESVAARRILDPRWDPIEGLGAAVEVKKYLKNWASGFPDDQELHTGLTMACMALLQDDEAQTAAKAASPDHPRVLAVRGAIAFRKKDYAKAAEAFAAALAAPPPARPPVGSDDPEERSLVVHRPGYALAALGQARSLEELGDRPGALTAFDALLATAAAAPRSVARWQQLESHLGRARMLFAQARPDDARRALDDARQLDPAAADELASQLFPAS